MDFHQFPPQHKIRDKRRGNFFYDDIVAKIKLHSKIVGFHSFASFHRKLRENDNHSPVTGVRINRIVDIHEFVKRLGNPGSFDVKLLITSKQDEQTERTSRETFRDLILYLILSGKSREFVLLKATSSPSRILFLLSRRPLVPEERRFLE